MSSTGMPGVEHCFYATTAGICVKCFTGYISDGQGGCTSDIDLVNPLDFDGTRIWHLLSEPATFLGGVDKCLADGGYPAVMTTAVPVYSPLHGYVGYLSDLFSSKSDTSQYHHYIWSDMSLPENMQLKSGALGSPAPTLPGESCSIMSEGNLRYVACAEMRQMWCEHQIGGPDHVEFYRVFDVVQDFYVTYVNASMTFDYAPITFIVNGMYFTGEAYKYVDVVVFIENQGE